MFGARLASCQTGNSLLPLDATIVIFVAAPTASLQTRGGKATSGYKDDLDKVARTLDWSAQRSDKHNRRIDTIMAHCHGGGRVVVAVKSNHSKRFTLLGTVSHIDSFCGARFLVENGEHIVQERGTRTYHKQITAACLNLGLRSGVGLLEARYPVRNANKCRWCIACCYAPPKATLHFHELRDEGVAAYDSPAQWVLREEREKKQQGLKLERQRLAAIKSERGKGHKIKMAKAKLERCKAESNLEKAKLELDNIAVPVKRLRCKQPLKMEALEPAPLKLVLDAAEGGETEGTAEAEGNAAALRPSPPVTADFSVAGGGEVSQHTHPEPSPEEQVPAVSAVIAPYDLATAAAPGKAAVGCSSSFKKD